MTDEVSKHTDIIINNVKKLTSKENYFSDLLDPLHILTFHEIRALRDGVRFCDMEKAISNAASLKEHLGIYSKLRENYVLDDEQAIAAEEISYAGNQILELLTEESKSCLCKRKENPLKDAGVCTKCLKK